jgi:hypothetical protein
MTTKQTRNREYHLTADGLLDHMIDGKIVDTGEMYDRLRLAQQLSIMLSLPTKHAPGRVR